MANSSDALVPTGPLSGLRVLDISTVVAGPFASTLLADLGAEVLKAEMPGEGDALRRLAPHKNGVPLWWKVTNRNKRGITLDLRKPEGKALLGRLVAEHDVLVENFRTGTLDEWGLTRGWLQGINRSEEHTSELQSQSNLVCRLLLEKKKKKKSIREIKSIQRRVVLRTTSIISFG